MEGQREVKGAIMSNWRGAGRGVGVREVFWCAGEWREVEVEEEAACEVLSWGGGWRG